MIQKNTHLNSPALSDVLGESCSSEAALKLITRSEETYRRFQSFPEREQKKILSFIEGQRGLKITYDAFF